MHSNECLIDSRFSETLKRTAEQNRQEYRENKRILIRNQITEHSLQARLRLLETCGTVGDYGNSLADQLNRKLELLQRRRSVTSEERLKLDTALAEKQTLIEETLAQYNAIEEELSVKRKDGDILFESKLSKEIEVARVEAFVSRLVFFNGIGMKNSNRTHIAEAVRARFTASLATD